MIRGLLAGMLLIAATFEIFAAEPAVFHVQAPGTLRGQIPEGDRYSIVSVKITGDINMSDIMLLRDMAGAKDFRTETEGALTSIDLSETAIKGDALNPYLVMEDGTSYYSKDNTLGEFAFYGCKNLRNLKLPSNLKKIGGQALGWCTSLQEIILPEGLEEIGFAAFTYCESVKSLVIPESVTKLNDKCFEWMSELTTLRLNESIRVLPPGATTRLYKLEYIYFGRGLRVFEKDMFFYLPELKRIEVSEDNPKYKSVDGILYSKDLSEIISYPNGYQGESFIIPEGVSAISDYCFGNSVNLIDIRIPGHVKSVGDYAFWFCEKLESAIVEEGVMSLGVSCFENCHLLSALSLPSTLSSIGAGAFNLTYKLDNIDLSGDNENFVMYEDALYSKDMRRLLYVNSFAGEPFEEYKTEGCVMVVESGALCYLPEMKSLIFSDGVRTIRGNAVSSAFKLESVTLGNSVSRIEAGAISFSPTLKEVNCMSPMLTDVAQGAFSSPLLEESGTLYVPLGTKEFYLNQPWVYDCETRHHYFANVEEKDFTAAVIEIGVSSDEIDVVYITPDGKTYDTPQRGINIVRSADGRVKKILF